MLKPFLIQGFFPRAPIRRLRGRNLYPHFTGKGTKTQRAKQSISRQSWEARFTICQLLLSSIPHGLCTGNLCPSTRVREASLLHYKVWYFAQRSLSPLLVIYLYVFSFLCVTVDCMDPTCSGRGVCVRGECHCSVGWGGTNCETPRATCLDQCSGHGTFLPDTGLCSCDPSWTGHDCSIGKCGSGERRAGRGQREDVSTMPQSPFCPDLPLTLLSYIQLCVPKSLIFSSFPELQSSLFTLRWSKD